MDSSLVEQLVDQHRFVQPFRWWLSLMERSAVRRSLGVVAVCESLADIALRHDPTTLVRRLEDTSLLDGKDEVAEVLSRTIGSNGPIVLYVGNLQPYQGIDLLLRGFQEAHTEVRDAHLAVIGGSDEDIRRYRRRAERLKISDYVHFLGPRSVSHLGGYLKQADVLVSPRLKGTNTPMKIYSYLDSGRPILATRLPTHTQVLDDTIACLVDPEPEAMGHGLVALLRDAGLRARLAAAGRRRFREEFSPTAFERKLGGFYDDVERRLGRRGDSTPSDAERP